MDDLSASGGRILSFVERVENLEREKTEIADGIKEVYAEAKGEGYDTKILREIVTRRKRDSDEIDEHETLLDVYLRAIEEAAAKR